MGTPDPVREICARVFQLPTTRTLCKNVQKEPEDATVRHLSSTRALESGMQMAPQQGEGAVRHPHSMLMRIAYLNARKGRGIGEVALQEALRQEMHVMAIGEPAGEPEKTTRHSGWKLEYRAKDLAVYARLDVEVEVRGFGEYAVINQVVVVTYLKPTYNARTLVARLRNMAARGQTILGDVNCCGQRKSRALNEWLQNNDWSEVAAIAVTHRWKDHACSIDKILTGNGARAIAMEDEWIANSDHASIAAEVVCHFSKIPRKVTDWDALRSWADQHQISREEADEFDDTRIYGEAYEEVRKLMASEWQREIVVCERSKRWWKKREWKELRKRARKHGSARKELQRQIKEAKAECWQKWISEGRDVWQCARVARNPFGLHAKCGDIMTEDGRVMTELREKGEAFAQYNLITDDIDSTPGTPRRTRRRIPAGKQAMARVMMVLKRTKNSSTAGPDGISWRVWKILKNTRLGRDALQDAAQCGKLCAEQPPQWREARITMIPKPGKDRALVKSWRPITLSNTIGKLTEKLVAEEVQSHEELWHKIAFAGRKGRGAMDSVMLAKNMLEENDDLRMVGRDIRSALNGLRADITAEILQRHRPLQQWVSEFLRPCTINIWVDGKVAYTTTMTAGTPQGSPLSPSLFSIYASEMVWRAQRTLRQQAQQRRSSKRLRKLPEEDRLLPLSYIDDINTLVPRTTRTNTWHEQLDKAAESVGLKWDKAKDWEGSDHPHLGVYIGNERRHWKERLKKARGMWECVRRLTRLPPMAKRTIVCGQLIPILCYGCEAFDRPNEEMRRLVRMWSRWVVGAWRGSNAQKIESLSGIDDLDEWFGKRRIRWAASVYGRHLPELRPIAEKILQQRYEGHNVQFRWMEHQLDMAERKPFVVRELNL